MSTASSEEPIKMACWCHLPLQSQMQHFRMQWAQNESGTRSCAWWNEGPLISIQWATNSTLPFWWRSGVRIRPTTRGATLTHFLNRYSTSSRRSISVLKSGWKTRQTWQGLGKNPLSRSLSRTNHTRHFIQALLKFLRGSYIPRKLEQDNW